MKTVDFLDALKRQHSISSDYALAKLMKVRATNLSNYRRGVSCFDDDMAIRVAEIGGWPVGYVLACVAEERAERTKRFSAKKAWHEVAKALAPLIVGVAVGVGALFPMPRAHAAFLPFQPAESAVCILCQVVRRWLRACRGRLLVLFLGLFGAPLATASDWYVGAELSAARFENVGGSSAAIIRKLDTEGFASHQHDAPTDTGFTPVLGWRGGDFGVELGARRYAWRSRVESSAGATNLISSDDGSLTPIDSAQFSSESETTMRAVTLSLVYAPGALYSRLGVARMDVRSRVFEQSDAIGRTPQHVESRAGHERLGVYTWVAALGYQWRGRDWSGALYVEAIGDVGNDGAGFVDGGGVENQTLPVVAFQLARHF